ncbi:hypothetical protein K435DRAFT_801714 [Dendrothele bispora CBS 962.96]|uniref:Uncharacterized protein n=1 Tax=Dendrothele bispora (strain CBS 962.96) TaxID=1314807 RepID=A0A4S8LPT1_DENBC|nr:hypothetical protein K435DRAFT_801714 [Dendrothele bispora CBS 962.96]
MIEVYNSDIIVDELDSDIIVDEFDSDIIVDELDLYPGRVDDHLYGIDAYQHIRGWGNNRLEVDKKQAGKKTYEDHEGNNRFGGSDELKMTDTNIYNTTDDPIPQNTPETSFEELNYDGAKNQSGFHQSSGTGDIMQDKQEIINNEHLNTPPHEINGGYTEQDNRRIEHNIEYVETYYDGEYTVNNNVEGNLKALCVGGALTGGGFYLGQTTAQVEGSNYHYNRSQPALPGNKALVIYFPDFSVDQLPSLVLTVVMISKFAIEIFCFVRQTVFGGI